jgi:hypothetical protein
VYNRMILRPSSRLSSALWIVTATVLCTISNPNGSPAQSHKHRHKHQKAVQTVQDSVSVNAIADSPATTDSDSGKAHPIISVLFLFGALWLTIKTYRVLRNSLANHSSPLKKAIQQRQVLDMPLQPVETYFGQHLGFDSDPTLTQAQKDIIECLMLSLSSYHETDGSAVLNNIGDHQDPQTLHSILKNAVVEPGGLIEFLQVWILCVFRQEAILIVGGNLSIDDLIEAIRRDALDDDSSDPLADFTEEQISRMASPNPLSTIFPINTLSTLAGGKQYNWVANESLRVVYEELVNWNFVKHLTQLPPITWKDAILTDDVFERLWHKAVNGYSDREATIEAAREEWPRTVSAPKTYKSSTGTKTYDPVLEALNQKLEREKKRNSNTSKEQPKFIDGSDGRVFDTVAPVGIPIALVRGNKLFEGYAGLPPVIAVREGEHVAKGLFYLSARIVSTYDEQQRTLHLGRFRAKMIAYYRSGQILDEHFHCIGSYEGSDEGISLAMSFLTGLLD